VRFASETFPPLFWCLDDQRTVAVIPIGRFFVFGIGVRFDFAAMRLGIEILFEGIFRHPPLKAPTGQLATLEQSRFIIAGPTMATGAGFANVAG